MRLKLYYHVVVMELDTFRIALLCLIGSLLVVFIFKDSYLLHVTKELFAQTIPKSNISQDSISYTLLQLLDFKNFAQKFLDITPIARNPYYSDSVAVFPGPPDSWVANFENVKMDLYKNIIQTMFETVPNTIFLFARPFAKGKLVFVPFSPLSYNQSLTLDSKNANNAILYYELLDLKNTNSFSAFIPRGYKLTIVFENNTSSTFIYGFHASIPLLAPLVSITILKDDPETLQMKNFSSK